MKLLSGGFPRPAISWLGLIALLWFGSLSWGAAELIPSARRAPWVPGVTVGVPRGIPTDRTNLIDVTKPPYNADRTGVADTREAIAAAIRAAKSNDVVFLPAGRYRVDSPIHQQVSETSKSFYTIRGAGTNTVIDWRCSWGSAFSIGRTANGFVSGITSPDHRIIGGLTQGSSNLVVNGKFDVATTGPMIRLTQRNDKDVFSVFGFEYLQSQMVMVMGVNGSNVSIWPPLYTTLKTNLNAAYAGDGNWVAYFAGLEDMVIDATNSWSGSPVVHLGPAYGCWVKNVQVLWAANYGITTEWGVQCDIRSCACYGSKHRTPGDWSNHGGFVVGMASACRFEDNIGYQFFPHIEINGGASGNVFAYNYLEDNNVNGMMGVSLDSNHNPHNHHNLFEGNVSSKFQCDGYFGGASDDTLFRNWFHGTCPGTSENAQCINLNRFSYRYSVVGNVLGTTNLPFKYDNTNNGYAYSERLIYCLGLPYIGNGGFNGKLGPPWAQHVIDGGSVLVNQRSNRLTAPVGVFTPDMVGQDLVYDEGIRQTIQTLIDSRTLLLSAALDRTNQHYKIGPGPGGYGELDTNVLATLIRIGNFNYATTNVPPSEALGTNLLPPSLCYTTAPEWWPAGKPWPPIGPDRKPMVTPLPAQDRFRQIQAVNARYRPERPSHLKAAPSR